MALLEGQRQAGEQSGLRPQKGHLFKVVFLLIGLLGVLAVWLCFGDQGLVRLYQTEAERQACGERIRFLAQENQALMDEIRRLRTDMQYVEWVARKELNLVKENEMVFRFKERPTGSQSLETHVPSPAEEYKRTDLPEYPVRPDEPHDILEKILEEAPSQNSLILILGRMRHEGRHQEVVQQAAKALRLYPEDLRLRLFLVEAYLHVGFIGLAEEEFSALRDRLRPLASEYKRLAQFFSKAPRGGEAENALRQYLAKAPDDSDAHAQPHLPGREKATEDLEETSGSSATDPSSSDEPFVSLATPTLAELYYAQGQIDLALETYGEVLGKNPGDEASKKRLSEIRSMKARTSEGQQRPLSPPRMRFMIHVLETWRRRIEIREGD